MKIIIGVHHFPPRYTGGAEWQAYRTARALQARGHEVHVVCVEHADRGPASGVGWQDDVYEGVPVRRLSFNMKATPDPKRFEYQNEWIGSHLSTWLSEEKPHLFHLIGGYLLTGITLQVVHELGIPVVLTLTDLWFLCPQVIMLRSDGRLSRLPINPVECARCVGENRNYYRRLGRLLPGLMSLYWRWNRDSVRYIEARWDYLLHVLGYADRIISVSQFICGFYVEAGVAPERVVHLRQGLDLKHLTPEALVKQPSDRFRVGYIGQIAELKGVHVLAEAVRYISDPRLDVRIYGNSSRFPRYTDRLRKIIGSDQRVQFAGEYRGAVELTQIMQSLDVIIVPSICYENSPTVILEAFAHQTPVVASDFAGMAELVQHEQNGLRFALGDAASLAGQLKRLLNEPDLLPRLRAGIGPVKTVAEETDALEAIYREVLAERTGDRLKRSPVV